MIATFCNPVEHAIVLIDACGSLDAARETAELNSEGATNATDFLYWFHVVQALTPSEVCA